VLPPQEEVAAILTGRRSPGASEDLLLRARLDLEQGRARQAALQLRVAIDALEAELVEGGGSPSESPGFRDHALQLDRIAEAALRGEAGSEQTNALAELLREIEQTVRRRRHSSL
jgi:hypothetical protein